MLLESRASTAIEPGLSGLLEQERKAAAELPLPIRRFVQDQNAAGVVEAAVRASGRLLRDYEAAGGALPGTVRLSKLAELRSVALHGLKNVRPTRPLGTTSSQRYRAAITMGGAGRVITIPPGSDRAVARISVAHELGHLLIHSRGMAVDEATIRLGSSPQEETLAEYIGRLLLLSSKVSPEDEGGGTAKLCFALAGSANVPLAAALARIGDPDQNLGIAGAILWELRRDPSLTLAERLKPSCRLCGAAFIPDRSHAREGSLTVTAAEGEEERLVMGSEFVRIGRFVGQFGVQAYAWGSEARGTRKVLSTFSTRQ